MQEVNNKVEVVKADSKGNVVKNVKDFYTITSCTHPIVNQQRNVYTKWNKVKTSVQVGYCKVCDKIVMSEGQGWSILEKQADIKEDQNV